MIVPSSGIVTAKSARNSSRNASNSSSARSISSISSTTGSIGASLQRVEQRPAQQEAPREQLALVDPALGRPQREQLPRVVPVVHRVVQVDPLVALQADQARAGGGRQRSRHLGLADAGLALEQQRLLERDREMDRQRERPVGEIALGGERGARLLD